MATPIDTMFDASVLAKIAVSPQERQALQAARQLTGAQRVLWLYDPENPSASTASTATIDKLCDASVSAKPVVSSQERQALEAYRQLDPENPSASMLVASTPELALE